MSSPSKLITIILTTSFLFSGIITNAQSQTNSVETSTQSSQQSSLISTLPNGKKQLKKPLKLDYTNSKFKTDLDTSQKDAILKITQKMERRITD